MDMNQPPGAGAGWRRRTALVELHWFLYLVHLEWRKAQLPMTEAIADRRLHSRFAAI